MDMDIDSDDLYPFNRSTRIGLGLTTDAEFIEPAELVEVEIIDLTSDTESSTASSSDFDRDSAYSEDPSDDSEEVCHCRVSFPSGWLETDLLLKVSPTTWKRRWSDVGYVARPRWNDSMELSSVA